MARILWDLEGATYGDSTVLRFERLYVFGMRMSLFQKDNPEWARKKREEAEAEAAAAPKTPRPPRPEKVEEEAPAAVEEAAPAAEVAAAPAAPAEVAAEA